MSTTAAAAGDQTGLKFASGPGRWVLLATVLGSAIASIDATVVGIALPAIGRNFSVGFAALQWVVTAYTLTLAGLLLIAGALGDKYGRKRIFQTGVIWFAVASALSGIAPSVGALIAARAPGHRGGAADPRQPDIARSPQASGGCLRNPSGLYRLFGAAPHWGHRLGGSRRARAQARVPRWSRPLPGGRSWPRAGGTPTIADTSTRRPAPSPT